MSEMFKERLKRHRASIEARLDRFEELVDRAEEADRPVEGITCELCGAPWRGGVEMYSAYACRICVARIGDPEEAAVVAAAAMMDRFDAE
jgi:hypothetical protein